MNRRGTNVFVKSTKSSVDNGRSLSDPLPLFPPEPLYPALFRTSGNSGRFHCTRGLQTIIMTRGIARQWQWNWWNIDCAPGRHRIIVLQRLERHRTLPIEPRWLRKIAPERISRRNDIRAPSVPVLPNGEKREGREMRTREQLKKLLLNERPLLIKKKINPTIGDYIIHKYFTYFYIIALSFSLRADCNLA